MVGKVDDPTRWHHRSVRSPSSDNDWGACTERKESKFVTDKYADTGKRWFGVRDGAMVAIYIPESDTMEIRIARNPWIGIMKRGDKNPFSK